MFSMIKYYDRYDIMIKVYDLNIQKSIEQFILDNAFDFLDDNITILEIKLIDVITYNLYK